MAIETADPLAVEQFLALLKGTSMDPDTAEPLGPSGELTAALAVGWTPRKLKALKKDPDFLLMMNEARTEAIESVEQMTWRLAMKGVRWASELVLFNHAADRGWRPPTQRVEVSKHERVDVSIVASVKEAAMELLDRVPIGELQGADIMDAEVVDDDG